MDANVFPAQSSEMNPGYEIDASLNVILSQWRTHKEQRLNVFRLVSAVYFKENFHSDVIATLLKRSTHPHSVGLFVRFLKTLRPELIIDEGNYTDAEVYREPGRIDILIESQKRGNCIIIENKINDAIDQPQQLSGYFEKMQRNSRIPDAVVYLTKDKSKKPSKDCFSEQNRKSVERVLVEVSAFDSTTSDLVTGWLQPLLRISEDDSLKHLLHQYIDILTELGQHTMNAATEMQFLEWLKTGDNFARAERITELFNDRIRLALTRILANYHDPKIRKRWGIVSAKVSFYRGWMATIEVRKGDGMVMIEMSDSKGSIHVQAYLPSGSSPAAAALYDGLKPRLATLISKGEATFKDFAWPEEEAECVAMLENLLMLLQCLGPSPEVNSVA